MKKIFVSHIVEHAPLASALKQVIEISFEHKIKVFVASDAIPPGTKWLEALHSSLKESEIILLLSSPASISRPWINFEIGCGWINEAHIIPICHSGQGKDRLPYPFSAFQALEVEDPNFVKKLLGAIASHLDLHSPSSWPSRPIKQALGRLAESDAVPMLTRSPIERTKLIVDDLKTLKKQSDLSKEVVRHSAFLSVFAIPDQEVPEEGATDELTAEQEKNYRDLLMEEKNCLKDLAAHGCLVKCIIRPPTEGSSILPRGFSKVRGRINELLSFLQSKHPAHASIDWAVSQVAQKNLYVISQISCFEGHRAGLFRGYGLTLRQTSPEAVNANIQMFDALFGELSGQTRYGQRETRFSGLDQRTALRQATIYRLKESLRYLDDLEPRLKRSE